MVIYGDYISHNINLSLVPPCDPSQRIKSNTLKLLHS